MKDNVYINLTRKFNRGKMRAVICSGQAAVLHRLALMSKDGDWILKEDEESLRTIQKILAGFEANYRFGAPLDIRWMRGGWSSHFEYRSGPMRIRTDFFTRPPRIPAAELKQLWKENEPVDLPFVNLKTLAEMKKTNREKDYVIIGEIARLFEDPRDQLMYSRSARDIMKLAENHPNLITELANERPLLARFSEGREKLEELLDSERRSMIRANENRLSIYMKAAEKWIALWPEIEKEISGMPLSDAHQVMVQRAEGVLPFAPREIDHD